MHELSDYQRRKLLKNPIVEKVTEKHVYYTAAFKIWAVDQYIKGEPSIKIFESKGIDTSLFIKDYCRSCLKRWKKQYIEKGKNSFNLEYRGSGSTGRPRKPTYEELEAIVAIQREALGYAKK
jgi:transposase